MRYEEEIKMLIKKKFYQILTYILMREIKQSNLLKIMVQLFLRQKNWQKNKKEQDLKYEHLIKCVKDYQ